MSTTLQIRIDDTLRKDADALFADFGMDINGAVRLFLRQSVIRRAFPFKIVASDPFRSAANQRVLADSIASLESGEGSEHELIDAE